MLRTSAMQDCQSCMTATFPVLTTEFDRSRGNWPLTIKPCAYGARDQVGGVLLDEMSGVGNGHQREVFAHPVPGVVQSVGDQCHVVETVQHEHRHAGPDHRRCI